MDFRPRTEGIALNLPPLEIDILPNPGNGPDWALCVQTHGRFIWRLFDCYATAQTYSQMITEAMVGEGEDFVVTIAKLPTMLPSTAAIIAGLEWADAKIVEIFQRGQGQA